MRTKFSQFAQEGKLANFLFEPEPIKAVFSEILNLLASHESRLLSVESALPHYAPLTIVDQFSAHRDELNKTIEFHVTNTNSKITEFREEVNKQSNELREYVTGQCSEVLVGVPPLFEHRIE
jgi:hypothetical protein